MQPTDSGSPEKAIPVAVIEQEQQASAQARGLLRTFSALRHRNYRLFFFGQMISQIGTWMQTTAQAWLVLELTHSALLLVGVGFAQIVMTATANTTIQTVTPNYLRGRVISVYLLVYSGGMPLGNLLPGGLTTLFGAPIAFLIGGVPCFVAAIVGWILRKPAERSLAASMTAMSIE